MMTNSFFHRVLKTLNLCRGCQETWHHLTHWDLLVK